MEQIDGQNILKNFYRIQFNHNDYDVNEENCEPPTVEEVRDAIAKLRNGRTTGEDMISAELLKYGGEKLVQMLHDLIVEIWQNTK